MATGSLGSLVVSLAVDTAKFQGDLGRAAVIAERRMKNIRDTATRAFGALTIAATAAGTALTAMLTRSLRDADEMLKLAKSVGTTVEQLSALRYAADLAGVSQDELGVALKKLASTAVDASNGVSSSAAAFKALDITVERSNGTLKSTDELVAEIADAFAAAPDSITKTAIATDLFGKSGSKLIPLLNEGSEGLAKYTKEAQRFGLIISTEPAVAAEQFNDNLSRLKSILTGFGNLLAAELSTPLANFSAALVDGAVGLDRLRSLAESSANVVRFFASVFIVLGTALEAAGKNLGAFAAAFDAFFTGEFSAAAQIIRDRMADAEKEAQQSLELIRALYDENASAIAAAAPDLGADIAAPVTEAAKLSKAALEEMERFATQGIWGRQQEIQLDAPLGPTLEENAAATAEYFHGVSREMVQLTSRTFDLGAAFEDTAKRISVAWDQGMRNLQSYAADFFFDPFDKGLKGMLSGFVNIVRRMAAEAAAANLFGSLFGGGSGIGGFIGSLFGAGTGGGGGGLTGFRGFAANGMTLRPGEFAIAGEAGPEPVFGGTSGATIVPMSKMQGQRSVSVQAPMHISIRVDGTTDRTITQQQIESSVRTGLGRYHDFWRDQLSRGAFQ